MREIKWIIEGMYDVLNDAVLYIVLAAVLMALGLSSLINSLSLFMEMSGLFYLLYVSEKETWVLKELFIGLGMVFAGIFFDPYSLLIGVMVILIVFVRLYLK